MNAAYATQAIASTITPSVIPGTSPGENAPTSTKKQKHRIRARTAICATSRMVGNISTSPGPTRRPDPTGRRRCPAPLLVVRVDDVLDLVAGRVDRVLDGPDPLDDLAFVLEGVVPGEGAS